MNIKAAVSVIVLILPLAALTLSRTDFLQGQKAPTIAEGDLLKQLNIERFEKKILAPPFTLKDLRGRPVNLQDLRGRVIFLNFWATWCPPCRLEMPTMEELHKEFGEKGLMILAINLRENAEEVKAFLKEHHLTFTSLLDREGQVFDLYQAWSLPTTYIINKKGEIVGKVIGYRNWHSGEAKALFLQLLEGKV